MGLMVRLFQGHLAPTPEFPGCFPYTLLNGGENIDFGVQDASVQILALVRTR